MINLPQLFEKYQDEYIMFDRVENKTSNRPDLHAFILLDKLVPGTSDLIGAAEHDEIWLDITKEDLEKVATAAIIVELIRCGVRYDDSTESFAMFV